MSYGPPPGYPPAGSFSPPGGYGAPPDSLGPGGPRPDGLGIAALIVGILGVIVGVLNLFSGLLGTCCVLCTVGSTFIAIIGLVPSGSGLLLANLSLSRIKRHPGRLTGKGLALAALVVSGAATLLCVLEVVLPWLGLGFLYATGIVHPSTGPTVRPPIFPPP
jgi:hypothetical protein